MEYYLFILFISFILSVILSFNFLVYFLIFSPIFYLFIIFLIYYFDNLNFYKLLFYIFNIFLYLLGYTLVNNRLYHFNNALQFEKSNNYEINNIKALVKDISYNSDNRFKYNIKINLVDYNFIYDLYLLKNPKVEIDDIIIINSLKLSKNHNNYSYKNFLKNGSINRIFQPFLNYNLIERRFTFKKIINKLRYDLEKSLSKKFDTISYNLFKAIFLGHSIKIDEFNIKDKFKFLGLSHYLARSGLHLTIINNILMFILFLFPINGLLINIFSIIILFIYKLLTYDSVSFLRSFLMILIYNISKIINYRITALSILFLSGIFLLIYNPFYLIFLDFQLSFFFTFIILIFNKLNNIKKIILLKREIDIS